MQIDKLVALWQGYRQRGVDSAVHPDDHMFKSNPLLDDYEIVGESGLKVIHSVLAMSRKEAVYNILDFGCGHGRVARYVRAMFPKANLSCRGGILIATFRGRQTYECRNKQHSTRRSLNSMKQLAADTSPIRGQSCRWA